MRSARIAPDPGTGLHAAIDRDASAIPSQAAARPDGRRRAARSATGAAAATVPMPIAARGRAIANALAPADFTGKWTTLAADGSPAGRGDRAIELATARRGGAGDRAGAARGDREPGRTAALVTPDRALARRVAAHSRAGGSPSTTRAGQPLSLLPPGTLLLALAEAAAQRFAPLALLALLKHPLVRGGEARLAWLDGVRAIDRRLRGPRPPAGLDGHRRASGRQADRECGGAGARAPARPRRSDASPAARSRSASCSRRARDGAGAVRRRACGPGPTAAPPPSSSPSWSSTPPSAPRRSIRASVAPLLRTLLDEVAVRPPQGGHPRIAIYGLIEARLQSADLMILGGLNEGVWPGRPAPDPWLAPRIRAALGLPGLERRIGVAAHDFAQCARRAAGAVTRARRDAASPALASRFWLRLQAMAGDRFERDARSGGWARALDDRGDHVPADRPAPRRPCDLRPRAISVTEVDRLKADPYAFYARRILGLSPLDPVDADPSAAWRGTEVHAILEEWWDEDRCAADALPRAPWRCWPRPRCIR